MPHKTFIINDSDADYIDDGWERLHNLDPNYNLDAIMDSDGDGLDNLIEFILGTDPSNDDSDYDGMTDGWEIMNHLYPLISGDSFIDFDGDTFYNLEEFLSNTNPNDGKDVPETHISSIYSSSKTVDQSDHETQSSLEKDTSQSIVSSNGPTLPIPMNFIYSLLGLSSLSFTYYQIKSKNKITKL